MPVVQLPAHAKSSTLYGRSYGRMDVGSYGRTSKFFRLDGLLLFCIVMGLRSANSAISHNLSAAVLHVKPSCNCNLNDVGISLQRADSGSYHFLVTGTNTFRII